MSDLEFEIRSIDGTGNNQGDGKESWGTAGQTLGRILDPVYGDDASTLAGADRPNPRDISNAIFQQQESITNAEGYSELFTVWGQFVDHDIDLTPDSSSEHADVDVPFGDAWFDPMATGDVSLSFTRSGYIEGTGTGADNPREHPNVITSFLDASMVYGSDAGRATALRDVGGKLKLSDGGLLPFNDPEDPLPNGGPNGTTSFLAGDVRANENVALTTLHTVFVREHNLWVDRLAEENPDASDEWLYQKAKTFVEAEIQHITYTEYLPLLLGTDAIPAYQGYDPDVDPGITTEFSTTAFRFGHSMVGPLMPRLDENGETSADGDLDLKDAFFAPDRITDEGGIDPILRGIADMVTEELDAQIVDGLRNFLFGPPGAGGLDLATLNIQRGRDHGLPSYNEYRAALVGEAAETFADITSDPVVQAQLEAAYGTVDKVDLWVGGLAEDHLEGAIVGPVFHAIIADQFVRIRDGDSLWHENGRFTDSELAEVRSTSLADVIERTTGVEHLQDGALLAYDRQGGTGGDDYLTGTTARDLLLGLDGDDMLAGLSEDDQLIGGQGDDTCYGGDGEDKLEGQGGDDVLLGNGGSDTLVGGNGNDSLHGQEGDDALSGGDGDDRLEGGAGNDLMWGGSGADTLVGGDGADTFVYHQDDVDFMEFSNPVDLIQSWDSEDVIKLVGGPEFVPVRIQWGVMYGSARSDDVRILLANGQKIYIEGAVLDSETPWLDSGAPNVEFQAGFLSFIEPLMSGANADDFEHAATTDPECDILADLL